MRGLTFIDVPGLRELLKQNEFARDNRHVLVDDPDDVAPPVRTD